MTPKNGNVRALAGIVDGNRREGGLVRGLRSRKLVRSVGTSRVAGMTLDCYKKRINFGLTGI